MQTGRLPRFDPADPAIFADPYPEYARLRAAGPLARGFGGQWVLTRHAEISAVLRDRRATKLLEPAVYESLVGPGPSSAFLARMQELFHHRVVTGLLVKAFHLKFTPRLDAYATAAAERLVAPALDTGVLDAVADLGVAFPVDVVCELFGVPEPDRETFRRHVADMVIAYNDAVVAVDAETARTRRANADEAVRWQQAYLRDLVAERIAAPADDVLSALVAPSADGTRLSPQVVVDATMMCFYAGFETAMAMITTGLAILSERPDQWHRLRSDRSLVATAVEEFVRYDAPIQIGVRRVLERMEVDGQTIRPGRMLVLLLGSANRDELVFGDPDRLDIGRHPNPHLAYGGGTYFCLGAALARLEGAVVLETLVRRCAALEPAGPTVRRRRFNFRTYASVPLAVTPA